MAVGGEVTEFDKWLNNKLLEFNTDEGVFGSYIRGILEGEEPLDEKAQALEEILSEITAENITKICQEILEKWKNFRAEEESSHKTVLEVSEDVDVKLARLMESQAKATTVTRNNYTDEERRIREAILQQYGQMSDDDDDDEAIEGEKGSDNLKENRLVKNTNATAVQQAEKEKREKAKIDSQKKKEKDKEDREKQKQLTQEKKEKRKTQKRERRRAEPGQSDIDSGGSLQMEVFDWFPDPAILTDKRIPRKISADKKERQLENLLVHQVRKTNSPDTSTN